MTTRHRFSKKRFPGIDFSQSVLRTKQSERDACNINLIMAKYVKTGLIEHGNNHRAAYGVVPEHDFRQALEILQQSDDMFSELPAPVRRRFNNDPAQFLAFCDDPTNLSEARLLGLADPELPPPATEPDPPPATPGATPSAPT